MPCDSVNQTRLCALVAVPTPLFAREDAVEAQWRIVDPVLGDATPVYEYPVASFGPSAANGLLGPGDAWIDPEVSAVSP